MRAVWISAAVAGAALAATYTAHADDSSATLAAGGLVLTKNADIRMAAEDLTITPTDVRVRYEFANDSGHDIDTVVAFPLPKVDMYEYSEVPIGGTIDDPVNFVHFEVRENGKPIATRLQARALANGRDVSAKVRASGLPIGIYSESFNKALDNLPAAKLQALVSAGLMEVDGDARRPKWTVELMYYWTEHFPAGRTVVIEHHYKPVSGEQFFGRFSLSDAEQRAEWVNNFCLDAGTQAAIGKALDALEKSRDPNSGSTLLLAYTTGFVLVTGNNWKGPIGRFHLTLDKLKPGNILSLCWNAAPLRKTGPTRFESTVTNFSPTRDLNVAVLQAPDQQ
jgi:Domain of unknown function (DUF4424)